jgi:large subunit ribosomal protein L31e
MVDKEVKVLLEREYIVPLRKKVVKVQQYKRAKKAIRILREFLVKHMKVEGRDLKKIKIDRYLNEELWFRGIKKPPAKIKVKAIKKDDGNVYVELVDIPDKIKWTLEREKKKKAAAETTKKPKEKTLAEKSSSENEGKSDLEKKAEEERANEGKQDEKEEKEKQTAAVESKLKDQEKRAKSKKHETKPDNAKQQSQPEVMQRKALKR